MLTSSITSELQNFVRFATRRIEQGDNAESLEELVEQWRRDSEFVEAVADVRQGLADDAADRAESASTAFADIRRQLGISE